ncbi:MAG: fibronectin type III domain-containing protein [Opitutaceae bacterium]|jgi:hypothetical protein
MASNGIPQGYEALISLAEDAAGGAHQHGAAIALAQNTEDKIRADRAALAGDPDAVPPVKGAQEVYNEAKEGKTTAAGAEHDAEDAARELAMGAVGVLKKFLGRRWNSNWVQAGFRTGSLAIPRDPLPLLGDLRAYFAAHANQEVAVLEVTAAACAAQAEALSGARTAGKTAEVELGQAKQARDEAQQKLFKRLSGLLSELGQLLKRDDPRWYAFGFDRPADGQQPGPVQHLALTAGGPGIVLASWGSARRVERYRVLKQVAGVDAAPVLVDGSLHENAVTLQGLPSGKEVTLTVVPVNTAGEGPATVSAALLVP